MLIECFGYNLLAFNCFFIKPCALIYKSFMGFELFVDFYIKYMCNLSKKSICYSAIPLLG